MAFKLGSITINKAYLGSTEINKIMLGSTEVFSVGSAQVGTAPNAADCLAYYKLDETSGTTADNAEGTSARDGTASNSGVFTTEITGVIDTGADFTSNYNLNLNTATGTTGDFSINFWFQPRGTNENQRMAETMGAGYMGFIRSNTGTVQFRLWDTAFRSITTSALSTNTYYMASVVVDGTADTFKLYIDGEQVGSTTTFTGFPSSENIRFGTARDGSSLAWNGYIDEIAVFDVALTADEITYLYQLGNPTSKQQYPFT